MTHIERLKRRGERTFIDGAEYFSSLLLADDQIDALSRHRIKQLLETVKREREDERLPGTKVEDARRG